MSNRSYVPLRERALRAWNEDRPKRAAKLLRRINQTSELRRKLEKILGHNLPIEVVIDLQDRPIAVIENLRFTLTTHGKKHQKSLILMDSCPRCSAETGTPIDNLADLGQLLEHFGTHLNLGCSACVGLTENELKPSKPSESNRRKFSGRDGSTW
jgi:hypothetical protein